MDNKESPAKENKKVGKDIFRNQRKGGAVLSFIISGINFAVGLYKAFSYFV